jgi:hypothetical protein
MLMLYSWSRSGRRYGLPRTAPRASTSSWGLSTGRDSARSRRSRPRRRGDHGPVFGVGRSASLGNCGREILGAFCDFHVLVQSPMVY